LALSPPRAAAAAAAGWPLGAHLRALPLCSPLAPHERERRQLEARSFGQAATMSYGLQLIQGRSLVYPPIASAGALAGNRQVAAPCATQAAAAAAAAAAQGLI